MEEKEREFKKKISVDRISVNGALIFYFIGVVPYLSDFLFYYFEDKIFNYSIILVAIIPIFFMILKYYTKKYNVKKCKIYTIIIIGLLIITCIFNLLHFYNNWYIYESWFESRSKPYFDWFGYTIAEIFVMFGIYALLLKAEDPEKYKESTDWFYEKYENKDNKIKKI